MTLKVGLIGAGGFGTIHLLGYVRNPNCKLVAIASRTVKNMRERQLKDLVSQKSTVESIAGKK